MSGLNDPGWDHFSLFLGWIRSRNKVVANFFARRFSLQRNFKDSMFRRWLLEMKLMYDYLVIQFSPLPFFWFLKIRGVKYSTSSDLSNGETHIPLGLFTQKWQLLEDIHFFSWNVNMSECPNVRRFLSTTAPAQPHVTDGRVFGLVNPYV